jgi:hypothetical protein
MPIWAMALSALGIFAALVGIAAAGVWAWVAWKCDDNGSGF